MVGWLMMELKAARILDSLVRFAKELIEVKSSRS